MKKIYEAPEAEVVLFEGQFAEAIYASENAKSFTIIDDESGNNE